MRRWLGPALVALGAVLWGTESAWRIPLGFVLKPDVIVLYEHVLMVIIFVPVLLPRLKGELRKATASTWAYLIFSGAAGSAVGAVLFTAALTSEHANYTAINVILNLQPVVSTAAAWLLFRERLSSLFFPWAALAVAAGMILSIENLGALTSGGGLGPGTWLALQCALFWGLATVAGRGVMRTLSMPLAAGLRVIVGLIAMIIICAARGELTAASLWPADAHTTMTSVRLVLLTTVSGALPLAFYFQGLKTTPASTAGYCEMMQTVAAAAITWLAFASPLSPHQIAAALLLMFSVAMVQQAQARPSGTSHPGRGSR